MYNYLMTACMSALVLLTIGCDSATIVNPASGRLINADSQSVPSFEQLVVFGDSYSNSQATNVDPDAGRPLVYADLLSRDHSKPLKNYAISGARVADDLDRGLNGPRQLQSHVLSDTVLPGNLYLIWGGYNDIISHLEGFCCDIDTRPTVSVAEFSGQLGQMINTLSSEGASKILVLNLIAADHWPIVKDTDQTQLARQLTLEFNSAIESVVANDNYSANVVLVDIYSFAESIFESPDDYGISNTAACDSLSCDGFFFADALHPGHIGHRLIAAEINNYITVD